jgi:hypothetical protein
MDLGQHSNLSGLRSSNLIQRTASIVCTEFRLSLLPYLERHTWPTRRRSGSAARMRMMAGPGTTVPPVALGGPISACVPRSGPDMPGLS